MGGYFKPLRRKIGLLTLFAACVFAAGWVRSGIASDLVMFSAGRNSMMMIVSRGGEFTCVKWGLPFDENPSWQAGPLSNKFDPAHCYDMLTDRNGNKPPKSRCLGPHSFGFLVTPLTLISAYLLLSRPRSPAVKVAE